MITSWGSLLEQGGAAASAPYVPLDILRRRHFMRGAAQGGTAAKVASAEECLLGSPADPSSQSRETATDGALTSADRHAG